MTYLFQHPRETLGLTDEAPRQAWLALRGDPTVPGSRFGLSSTRIFHPRLSLPTWLGRKPLGRHLPIVNLVNRTQTPPEEGWSVRVTQVRDFRGGRLTYDSHNGTDFAIPPGTEVTAAAPGHVVAVRNEYNRGGLKVYVDHGGGLLTSYHHLARALALEGAELARGQTLALSGYSGLDGVTSFGCVAPHVHYNTSIAGQLIDPFAAGGEVSMWRGGENSPRPAQALEGGFEPTRFDERVVQRALSALEHDDNRAAFARIDDTARRAWAIVIESMTYPTRFADLGAVRALFEEPTERKEHLTLPFTSADYDDVVFADDVGLRRG